MRNILSLVFRSNSGMNAGKLTTKCGSFTNLPLSATCNDRKAARMLAQNCLPEELAELQGYCIDDGSFDTLNVPSNKLKSIL